MKCPTTGAEPIALFGDTRFAAPAIVRTLHAVEQAMMGGEERQLDPVGGT